MDDVDFFVFHQANARIIDLAVKKYHIPQEKYYKNICEYGNTSAASIRWSSASCTRWARWVRLPCTGRGLRRRPDLGRRTDRICLTLKKKGATMKKLNEILGTEFPFIQGGMANIATGEFAAACSNAGALGMIATGGWDGERLRQEIRRAKELTDKPFGVNLMLMSPYADDIARIILEEGVKVVTTGAGNPGKYIPPGRKRHQGSARGGGLRAGQAADPLGVDAIIAEGTGVRRPCGRDDHHGPGPQVIDAVDGVPVVAAGGIADGRQAAAAFALGACGIQVGTCLLASEECPIHENYKQAILKAKDSDTVVTGRSVGGPSGA